VLNDIDASRVDKGVAAIGSSLERLVARAKVSAAERDAALGRITRSTRLSDLAACELVVEAATERIDLKLKIFAELDQVARQDAILASNTSSISLTKIAAATKRPSQVIGMHFFTEKLGKSPVEVKNSAGFVANRILLPMLNEAVFCLHEGLATAEDIDKVMKLGMAHPMGPLALADLIGLDTCLSILEVLHDAFGDPKYRACPLWREMVDAGRLGRKSGSGFFQYAGA
jgi:3-hydroxybutyryl-CoA dehydrogenase